MLFALVRIWKDGQKIRTFTTVTVQAMNAREQHAKKYGLRVTTAVRDYERLLKKKNGQPGWTRFIKAGNKEAG